MNIPLERSSAPEALGDNDDQSFAAFMAAAREAHRLHFPQINMRECDWVAFEARNRRARPRLRIGAQSLEIEVRSGPRDIAWEPLNMGNGRPLESKRSFADRYHQSSAEASAMGGKNSGKGKKPAS